MNNKQCRVTVWALLFAFVASNVASPALAGPFQDRGGGGGGGAAAAPRGAWAQARAAAGAGGGGGVMPMSAPMATAGMTGGFQANHAAMQAQAALTAANAAAAMQSNLPNNFPLDLSAVAANIAANVSQPTNILVGGTARFNGTIRGGQAQTIQPGQMVTPAQYVALGQMAATGKQTLILDAQGSATAGFLTMLPQGVSGMSELTIPQGVTVHSIGYTANNPFQVNGQATVNGALYALQSQAGSTAVLNFESLSVGASGLISGNLPSNNHILNGLFASNGMTMNVTGNVNNAGTISTPGALTINAGGTINNGAQLAATQAVISASTVNLMTGAGQLNNSGMIAATAGNVNVATELTKNLTINGTGGTMQALAGDINIGNANETGKVNLYMNGGNYLSQEMNLTSGDGAVEVNVGTLQGRVNIKAGLAHVTAQTDNLVLGDMLLTGDPSFYNGQPNGDIEIAGSLVFNGDDLAIVASRDVKTVVGCSSCVIDTSNSIGRGGHITIVAGADFTVQTLSGPPQGDPYPAGGVVNNSTPIGPNDANTVLNITGPSASGGKIDLATVAIGGIISSTTVTSASTITDASGGNVILVAFAPASAATASAPGTISLPPTSIIETGGGTYVGTGTQPGNSGNVLIIAGAGMGNSINLGAINTNNTQGVPLTSGASGFVSINAAQPIIVGSSCPSCTVQIQAGTLINPLSGSFAPNYTNLQKGNIVVGNVHTTYALQVIGGGSVTLHDITVDLPVAGAGPGVVIAAGAGVATHTNADAGRVIIDGNIHTNGLALSIVASGNIFTGLGADGIDSGATTGQGGTLVMVAGAATTLSVTGPFPVPYAALNITGASDTGGKIDLTGASSSGAAITEFSSQYSGGAGGQIIIAAYGESANSASGFIALPTTGFAIETGGADLTILAGAMNPTPPGPAIEIGNVDTTGSGTGNFVYVSTQQPAGTLAINPGQVTANFNNDSSVLPVGAQSIEAGGFLTEQDSVSIIGGKDVTLSGGIDNAANSNPSTIKIWAGVDSSGSSPSFGSASTISITGSITPSSSPMGPGNNVDIASGLDVEISGLIQADHLIMLSDTSQTGNLGTDTTALNTEVNSLSAISGGSVYITQSGGIMLNDSAAGSTGTFDLTTTSNGDITIDAPNDIDGQIVNLTAGGTGNIFQGNNGVVAGEEVTLNAGGDIGDFSTHLQVEATSKLTLLSGFSIYVDQTGAVSLQQSHAGTSGLFDLTFAGGDLTLDGNVTATSGSVFITSTDSSSVLYTSGSISADSIHFDVGGSVGSDDDSVHVASVNDLQIAADGDVFMIQQSTAAGFDLLTSNAGSSANTFELEFSGGNLNINGGVSVPTGTLKLTGTDSSSIFRTTGTLNGENIYLSAGGAIGAIGARIETTAGELLSISAGADAYVNQIGAFDLCPSGAGTSNIFDLTFSGGTLTIYNDVTAGTIRLTATDTSSIEWDNGSLNGGTVRLDTQLGGSIGTSTNRVLTAATSILQLLSGGDLYANQAGTGTTHISLATSTAGNTKTFDLTFSGGNISLAGNVTASGGTVSFKATNDSSSLLNSSAFTITGTDITLDTTGGGSIGSTSNHMITNAGSTLTIKSGADAYVNQNGTVSLNQSEADASTGVFNLTVTGDLTVDGGVDAQDITLLATNIFRNSGTITGEDLSLTATTGSLGSSSSARLFIAAGNSLTTSAGQNAYLDQTGALSLTGANVGPTGTFDLLVDGGLTIAGNVSANNLVLEANSIGRSGLFSLSGNVVDLTSSVGSIGSNTSRILISAGSSFSANAAGDAYINQAGSNATQLTSSSAGDACRFDMTFSGGNVSINGGITVNNGTVDIATNDNSSLLWTTGTISGKDVMIDTTAGGSPGGGIGQAGNRLDIAATQSLQLAADTDVFVDQTGSASLHTSSAGSTNQFNLSVTGGDLTLAGNVDAQDITIAGMTSASILYSSGTLTANTVTLSSGTGNLGANGTPISTATSTLSATTSGHTYLTNDGNVNFTSNFNGGRFELFTTSNGDIHLTGDITSSSSVKIAANGTGDIVQGGSNSITASSIEFSSGSGDIGSSSSARITVATAGGDVKANTTGTVYLQANGDVQLRTSNGSVIDLFSTGNIDLNGQIGNTYVPAITLRAQGTTGITWTSGVVQGSTVDLVADNGVVGQPGTPVVVNVDPNFLTVSPLPPSSTVVNLFGPGPGPSPSPSPSPETNTTTNITIETANTTNSQTTQVEQAATKIATDTTPISVTAPLINQTTTNVAQENASKANEDMIDGLHVTTSDSGTFDSHNLGQMNNAGLKVEQGNTPNYMILNQGSVLFQPPSDISVQVKEGVVDIPAGAMAFVMETGNDVSVFDMRDGHKAAVRVRVGGKTITMRPGQQVVLSRFLSSDFDQVNPSRSIAYRNQKTIIANENNVRAYSADFSVPSIMMNVTPLRQMLASDRPAERRAARKLLKNSVVVAQMTQQAPYKTSAQAAAP